jgi:hypothetical protein
MRKWLTRLLILLPVTVAGCDKPIITIEMKGQPPPAPRFQLVMHPQFPGPHTYLLDTQTGALWKPNQHTYLVDEPTVWEKEEVLGDMVTSGAFKSGTGEAPQSWLGWRSQQVSKEEAKQSNNSANKGNQK